MNCQEIKSPLPGTFYRRSSPEEAEFKVDGDSVNIGDVIGLIEVMKSFHEVRSDVDGVKINFCVEDGEAIMAGQCLAEVTS